MSLNSRKTNKVKVFDGESFKLLDAHNADSVNFITFRINNNTLEAQFNPSGNTGDLDSELWVPIVDMGITTLDSLKSKLTTLIEECRILSNNSPQGTSVGQWKPQIVTNFNIQINTAEVPLLSANPTVLVLSTMLSQLTEDKKKFERAVNTTVSLTKDILYALILECTSISDNAITAEGVSGVYDPDDKAVFNKHIETALYVYNDITAAVRQVNNARNMLELAKSNFLNSIATNIDVTALNTTVTTSKNLISSATIVDNISATI